ncbi:hypothetical protein F441_14800 [Phytophthora nicotianae CJ01A1]|uniref:Uncharacterized protein n=1 Tax=Phytophthora nicotianae CJ01A1 TaxID=1317063 RepID=W2WGU6_PHYNI|nr:hypothetical protein F441_14800 [Phytophthora nicotianae CJ01A1]
MYVDDTMVTVKECRDAVVRLFDARFERLERAELPWVRLLDPRIAKWMGYLPDKEKKKLVRLKLIGALVDMVRAEPPPIPDDQRGSTFSPPSALKAPNDVQIKHHIFGPNPRKQRQIYLKKLVRQSTTAT